MRVLVTGAFGNVGSSTVKELLAQAHDVTCFDLPTRATRKAARRWHGRVRLAWGDLRDLAAVEAIVPGHDVVVHIAAIIPPQSDRNPDLTTAVNIGGTRNLITAMSRQAQTARFFYTSSVALYGHQHDKPPPRTVDDPIEVTDHYTHTKSEAEKMVRESPLAWTIFRLGVVQPLHLGNLDPIMYEVPLWQRLEFVHTYDVGLAFANAVKTEMLDGKTLLVGGGPSCQMTYREYLGRILALLGLQVPPDAAFTDKMFHTDWIDTAQSQALLGYQRYTFDDFLAMLAANIRYQRWGARLFRPLAQWWLNRQSPYL